MLSFKLKSMRKIALLLGLFLSVLVAQGQQKMTPELLWQVKRISVIGLDSQGEQMYYRVSTPNMEENGFDSKYYKIARSEEHTSELQSRPHLVCRLLLEKK